MFNVKFLHRAEVTFKNGADSKRNINMFCGVK